MEEAVIKSVDNEELAKNLEGLSLRPEVMNRAVNNPISGLTLPDTLEKNRQEVIYNIKQQINIGLMTGERFDTMAKNVKKAIAGVDGKSGSYGKAINIVRTETHRVQESGFMDCAKDISKGLEGSGLIYTATWRTMKDQNVRPSYRVHTARGWKTKKARTTANHQKMEGVTIKVGDKFEIEPGVFAECPGSSGTARNDCNCRCYLEYALMSVEEFAKATGKSVEEVEKEVAKSEKGDIIKSGARITDVMSKEAEEFAASYYEEVRHFSTDYKKIASNLGMDENDIRKIKSYIFEDNSLYDEYTKTWKRFDPDCAIAHSWQRLAEGKKIEEHDYTLIKHELYEMQIKNENPTISHDEAHRIASKKYNYSKEADKYYDNLKKD